MAEKGGWRPQSQRKSGRRPKPKPARPRYTPGVTYLNPKRQARQVKRTDRAFKRSTYRAPARYRASTPPAKRKAGQRAQKARVRKVSHQKSEARKARTQYFNARMGRLPKTGKAEDDYRVNLAGYLAHDLFSDPKSGGIERANFEGFAERLWPKVSKYYGAKGKKMPPLRFVEQRDAKRLLGNTSTLGFVVRGKKRVWITPAAYKHALLRPDDRESRKTAKAMVYQRDTLLPHEWAHVYQPDRRRDLKANKEGGAEALARDITRRRGKRKPKNFRHPYNRYVKQVRRKKGRKWIRKGQFR